MKIFTHFSLLCLLLVVFGVSSMPAQPVGTPIPPLAQDIQVLLQRANEAVNHSPDSVGWYAKEAIRQSLKIQYRAGIAGGLLYFGRAEAAKELSSGDPFFRKSLMIYDSLDDAEGRAQCYNRLADTQLRKGRLDSCLHYSRLALFNAKAASNQPLLARVYRGTGAVYVQMEEYDSARKYLGIAVAYCQEHNIQSELAAAYDNYADVYYHLSEADAKAEMILKALRVNESLNSPLGMAYQYHKLAKLRASQLRFADAQGYYLKAIELYQTALRPSKVAEVKADYAEDFLLQEKYSLAVEIATEANKLAISTGDINSQLHSGSILVEAYAEQGKFDKALDQYEKCLVEANKSPNAGYICRLQMGLANAYLARNEITTARELLTQVLGIAQNTQDNYYIAESARMLYEVYHLLKQDEKALEYKLLYRETLKQGGR